MNVRDIESPVHTTRGGARSWLACILTHGMIPLLLYSAAFSLAAYSLLGTFFSAYWGDRMDGLQNAWNLWWVRLVLTNPAHGSIWHADLLHWPAGTTLVAHTLGILNGVLGAGLRFTLSPITTYNLILAFSLVTSSLSMYWLAYHLTRSTSGALLAGLVFGLSSFAIMHLASGQMNVVTMEWLPLFALCWHAVLRKPRPYLGAAAAITLWLVALSDYYYLLYCVLLGALMLGWRMWERRDAGMLFRGEYAGSMATFSGLGLLLTGSLVWPLLAAMRAEPFLGAHEPSVYSVDLLGILIPGKTWLFRDLTRFYWSRLAVRAAEGEACLALSVYAFMAYALLMRRGLEIESRRQLALWSTTLVFFVLLSLGPVLRVGGAVIWDGITPYSAMVKILPFVGLSGVPARMSVMVVFAAAILTAFGWREMWRRTQREKAVAVILAGLLFLQMIPAPIATTSARIPEFVQVLRDLPQDGGVVDFTGINPSVWLYYQTVHGKPIAFGYISRIPASVADQDGKLQAAIDGRDLSRLRKEFDMGYVIAAEVLRAPASDPQIVVAEVYERNGMRIYRLGCRCDPVP